MHLIGRKAFLSLQLIPLMARAWIMQLFTYEFEIIRKENIKKRVFTI